jgi:predicted nucleotidyltransferase
MEPSTVDLCLARAMAQRIVALLGADRVQRVVLIGSRARGTARPDSDMDLVVLVEIPVDAPPWGPSEAAAARAWLQRALGPPPVPTDLWVRTTDRYAEARGVAGGVERLVDVEGTDVFARPAARAPVVRRRAEQVRREHVSAWLEHAVTALEATARMERGAAEPGAPRSAQEAANVCAVRALTALHLFHGKQIAKAAHPAGMVEAVAGVDPRAAAQLGATLSAAAGPVQKAVSVVQLVLARLRTQPDLRGLVAHADHRIAHLLPEAPRR